MPKIIAHALTGATMIVALHPRLSTSNLTPLLIGAFLAVSADLDMIAEWLTGMPDIHRGLTHSLAFSIIVGLAIFVLTEPGDGKIALAYSFAYLSHPLLDLATSTAGGVKLFYPFSNSFYHLGLTNIFELPIGSNLPQILAWCKIELLVFLPFFLLAIGLKYFAGRFTL